MARRLASRGQEARELAAQFPGRDRESLLAALMLAAGCIAGLASPAAAHKSSDSYLSPPPRAGGTSGQWDIALRDLDYAIGIDSDNDGVITWGELRAHHRGDCRLCAV